jgi:hypothetical protein
MFLQVLSSNNVAATESFFENQLLLVILGLTFLVFLILRVAKILCNTSFNKATNNADYNS